MRQIFCDHDIIMISSWYFDNLFVCCNWSNRMAWILANLEQAMYQFSRKACLGQCPGWTLGTGWHSILQVCPVLQSRRSRCFANQPKTIIMEICMSWILVSPKLQPKCQAPSPNLTALPWQHQTPFNAAKAWNFRRGTLSFCPPFFFFKFHYILLWILDSLYRQIMTDSNGHEDSIQYTAR